jgi:hypothetical protein
MSSPTEKLSIGALEEMIRRAIGWHPGVQGPFDGDAERALDCLLSETKQMREALQAVVEVESECVYDHHGLCQEHNLRMNAAGEPECQIGLARAALTPEEPSDE